LFSDGNNTSTWASFSDANTLGTTIAAQYGLLTLLFLISCIFLAVLLAVTTLVQTTRETLLVQPYRTELCAGAIGTILGALLSSRITHPFMTADSVAGTAALAVAIASLPISLNSITKVRRVPPVLASRARTRQLWRRRWLVVGLCTMLTMCLWLTYENHELKSMVAPYAGSGLPPGFMQSYVRLPDISPLMRTATLVTEDSGFYSHRGFEWKLMHTALRLDMREAHVIAGGSTITQQLARNLFLSKDRTITRKIKEGALAFELEHLLSKDRILELYLNAIDYGMGQKGIGAAAAYYFGKRASQLSLTESALLAGLPRLSPPQPTMQELAVGRAMVLARMKLAWQPSYSISEFANAAATPVSALLRPTLLQSMQTFGDRPVQSSGQDVYRSASYWDKRAMLIGCTLSLGCVLATLLGRRGVSSAAAGTFDRKSVLPFVIAAALCSTFAVGAFHWYQLNRERLYYTVLYPYWHSPNYNFRPEGTAITCVVLHATAQESPWSTVAAFEDPSTQVSAHFVVGKDGEVIQMVPLEQRAWHAGVSKLNDSEDVNNFSVGIEMENLNNGTDPYSDLQYESVARIISQLRQRYAIADDRIVSHAQVALPAGHKTDPKGFNFQKLRTLLMTSSSPTREPPIAATTPVIPIPQVSRPPNLAARR